MTAKQETTSIMAARLKQLRESKHLSHERLSQAVTEKYEEYGVSISRDSLINYEKANGKNLGMRAECLRCLADFYGVSTDYLLGISDVATPNATVQAVTSCTGITEGNSHFLTTGRNQITDHCPPAKFEDNCFYEPMYQAYFRAKGALFLVNSFIEWLRNTPEMCKSANTLLQCQERLREPNNTVLEEYEKEYLKSTLHILSEEEYMRYVASETAKAFDAYLVSKCLSGTPAEQE